MSMFDEKAVGKRCVWKNILLCLIQVLKNCQFPLVLVFIELQSFPYIYIYITREMGQMFSLFPTLI